MTTITIDTAELGALHQRVKELESDVALRDRALAYWETARQERVAAHEKELAALHTRLDYMDSPTLAEVKRELAALKQAQGEPVAEVVSAHAAGLYDELPTGTLLYAAPAKKSKSPYLSGELDGQTFKGLGYIPPTNPR